MCVRHSPPGRAYCVSTCIAHCGEYKTYARPRCARPRPPTAPGGEARVVFLCVCVCVTQPATRCRWLSPGERPRLRRWSAPLHVTARVSYLLIVDRLHLRSASAHPPPSSADHWLCSLESPLVHSHLDKRPWCFGRTPEAGTRTTAAARGKRRKRVAKLQRGEGVSGTTDAVAVAAGTAQGGDGAGRPRTRVDTS